MNVNVSYNGFSLADAASCVMMRLPVPDLVWDMETLWKVWNEPIPVITPDAAPEAAPEPVRRRGGECFAAKPVTYAGKEYPSIAALAKAYGLGYKTCFARLRDGLPLEAPINTHPLPYRGKPVTIDGREYPSTKDAAKALGIPYTTLITRIRKGQDLSAPKYADRCEPITYQGKEYPSVEALSRATGINSRSWLYRIRHNIPLDTPWGRGGCKRRKDKLEKPAVPASEPEPKPDNTEAVRQAVTALPPKSNRYADEGNGRRLRDCPCELDGREYSSLDTMAVILDITLRRGVQAGHREREVPEEGGEVMNKGRKPVPVTYNGVTYESVYDCAAAFDLSADAVRWRLKHGLPLEPALGFRRMVAYDGRSWSLRELAEHCGVSPYTIARRLRRGGDPAFSGHCGRACEYGGKRYASVAAMARELEINWKNALALVESAGRWL